MVNHVPILRKCYVHILSTRGTASLFADDGYNFTIAYCE